MPDQVEPLRSSQPAVPLAALHEMMRYPRYWRDRDPALLAKVTEGFRRMYPDRE